MADPYYYTRDIFDIQNQRRALGQSGAFTPQDITSIMSQNFAQQQVIGEREREYALAQRRQTDAELQQAEQKGEASKAARMGAYFQGAQLAVNTPLAYAAGKSAGLWGTSGTATTATGATGTTGTTTGTPGTPAIEGSAGAAGSQAAITGFSPVAETLPGYSPISGAVGGQAAVTGAEGLGAGTVAGAGAAGVAGLAGSAWLTGRVFESHGLSQTTGRVLGAAFPMIAAPASAAVKAVEAVFGGSIVCTELNRQGFIKTHMLRSSSLYVMKYTDKESYMGYLMFTHPIVKAMEKSKLITYLMLPYGRLICRECASRTSPGRYKSTWLSRLTYNVSNKFFKWYYRHETSKTREVEHAC